MRVKLEFEFEIKPVDFDDEEMLTERNAEAAVRLAARGHLGFHENEYESTTDTFEVYALGIGKCNVKLISHG